MGRYKGRLGKSGEVDGAVYSVLDYFENTVGSVQINTVGKAGVHRQDVSKCSTETSDF